MTEFEYAIGLVSIVVGLAIGDMCISLHKLIRHHATIRWDVRSLLAASYAFIVNTNMWFQWWFIREAPDYHDYYFLMSLLAEMVLAFLAAAASLPDDPGPNFDLATFYDETARSFWIMLLLFNLGFWGHWIYFIVAYQPNPWTSFWSGIPEFLVTIGLIAVLAIWPLKRRLHIGLSILLIGISLYSQIGNSLT